MTGYGNFTSVMTIVADWTLFEVSHSRSVLDLARSAECVGRWRASTQLLVYELELRANQTHLAICLLSAATVSAPCCRSIEVAFAAASSHRSPETQPRDSAAFWTAWSFACWPV